jgi:hypothetical protein
MHGESGSVEEWRQVGSDRSVIVSENHDRARIRSAHDRRIVAIPGG